MLEAGGVTVDGAVAKAAGAGTGSRGAQCEIAVETSKNMECTSVLVGAGTQGLGKAYQDMKEPKPQTSQSWPEGGI